MNSVFSLGVVGAFLTLFVVIEMLRRQRLREKHAVIWIAVAMGVVLIAAVPDLLNEAAVLLGVRVPANLLLFGASMLLLLLSIQSSHDLGRLEERSRTLAEEVALLKLRLDEADDEPIDS